MRVLLLLFAGMLVGCATTETYVAPPLPDAPPPPSGQVAAAPERSRALVPSGIDPQADLLRLMTAGPLPDTVSVKESRRAVAEANTQAIIRPRRKDIKRAVVVYDHQDGVLFQIDTQEMRPTDLVFSGPEEVLEARPDEFFDVVIKRVGEPPTHQDHVVITPKGPDLETRMIIFTTKSAYHLHVNSYKANPMIAVRWRRPESSERLPRLLNPGLYYTGYDIEVLAGNPIWTPIEMWDSGLGGTTLVKLPPRSAVEEAPTLYVLADDGSSHVTNWQKRGDWYVIPRLATRFELRVGHTGQEVVRMSRGAKYHAVWCPSPVVTCPEKEGI